MGKIAKLLDLYADPQWRQAHKFWSIQLSFFWAVVSGLWVFIPALQGLLSVQHFLYVCVGMACLICAARLTNQPGLV